MVKLKCWKQRENTTIFQKNSIYRWIHTKHPERDVEIVKSSGDYIVHGQGEDFPKVFENKSQAVKFANKIMKSHDKC